MNDDMKSLGRRLATARTDANYTQTQVARILSFSKQSVSHWETGRQGLNVFDLQRVASLYGVSLEWLISGGVKPSGVGPKLRLQRGRFVPKASSAELIDYARGKIQLSSIKEQRQTYADCSAQSVSFDIFDDAMDGGSQPFKIGHIVTVDREVKPKPGQCGVWIDKKSGDAYFRRYKSSGVGKPLIPPYKLTADNPAYDTIEVDDDTSLIYLGTMVEHVIVSND